MQNIEELMGTLFTVRENVLRVEGDMYWEGIGPFEAACDKLLESASGKLEVDLVSANFVASSFLGSIANLALRAARRRKKVKIRATLDTGWLFEIMGGGRLLELEIV